MGQPHCQKRVGVVGGIPLHILHYGLNYHLEVTYKEGVYFNDVKDF